MRFRKMAIHSALGFFCLLHQATATTNAVLDKEFETGERISVIIRQRANTGAQSGSQRDYRSAWTVAALTEMVVRIHPTNIAEGVPVWTNTHFIFSEGDPLLGNHAAFDLAKVGTYLFLCYKEGPVLFVEEILSQRSRQTRERFWLARDSSHGVSWTNAAFVVGTNGSITLTAQGTRDATLTWEFRNGDWILDLRRSKPDFERELAYREWCLVAYEGDRWVVKRKQTEPMPKLKP